MRGKKIKLRWLLNSVYKINVFVFRSHGSDVLTVLGAVRGSFRATLDVASVIVLTYRMGSLGMFSSVFI